MRIQGPYHPEEKSIGWFRGESISPYLGKEMKDLGLVFVNSKIHSQGVWVGRCIGMEHLVSFEW